MLQSNDDNDQIGTAFKSAMSIDIDELSPEVEPPVLSLDKDKQDDVSKPPYFLKSSLSEPLPDNWKTIEGDFVFVMPVYLSHIGDDMLTLPTAKLEEPVMYLYCLKHGIVSFCFSSFSLLPFVYYFSAKINPVQYFILLKNSNYFKLNFFL